MLHCNHCQISCYWLCLGFHLRVVMLRGWLYADGLGYRPRIKLVICHLLPPKRRVIKEALHAVKSSRPDHFMYLKVECFYMFLHRVVQRICLKWRFTQSLLMLLFFCFWPVKWRNHLTVRRRNVCPSEAKRNNWISELLYCLKLCLHY